MNRFRKRIFSRRRRRWPRSIIWRWPRTRSASAPSGPKNPAFSWPARSSGSCCSTPVRTRAAISTASPRSIRAISARPPLAISAAANTPRSPSSPEGKRNDGRPGRPARTLGACPSGRSGHCRGRGPLGPRPRQWPERPEGQAPSVLAGRPGRPSFLFPSGDDGDRGVFAAAEIARGGLAEIARIDLGDAVEIAARVLTGVEQHEPDERAGQLKAGFFGPDGAEADLVLGHLQIIERGHLRLRREKILF